MPHIPRRGAAMGRKGNFVAPSATHAAPVAAAAAAPSFAAPEESAAELTEEEKSTGPTAESGDVPRDGRFPMNPYMAWVHDVNETCPNWSWKHAPVSHASTIAAMQLLPYPRPLPTVYARGGTYRPSGELGDRKRRMLHVFSCVLTFGLGIYMVLFHDHGNAYNKGTHVFSPLQKWAQVKLATLNTDPRIEFKRQQAEAAATAATR